MSGSNMSGSLTWTLQDEKNFVVGLGTHSLLKRPRIELLRGYYDSIANRRDWSSDQKAEMEAFTTAEISKELAKEDSK